MAEPTMPAKCWEMVKIIFPKDEHRETAKAIYQLGHADGYLSGFEAGMNRAARSLENVAAEREQGR